MAGNARVRGPQKGFIAAYMTYGIALIALVGVAYSNLSITKSRAQIIDAAVSDLEASVITFVQRIEACVTEFPAGDHGQFESLYAYPSPGTVGNRDSIESVECPGVVSGTATLNRFGYLPRPVTGFSSWDYQHTEADGVRLILVPAVADGEPIVRTRLTRRLQIGYDVSDGVDGELIISLVTP